jgi:LuxR family maltose regulon positive regulatory protein
VYREWNNLETATRYLLEGIDLCSQVGYIMDQVVGHVNLARVKQAQRDFGGAHDALLNAERLSQRMKGYVYVRRWVEDCQVRLWLAHDDLDAVAHWAQESELRADDELNFLRELEHIILARALVALGRERPGGSHIDGAQNLLARLRRTAETAGWMGKVIETLVLQALALQAGGEEEEALAALERALSLAEPEGYVRTFVDEGEPMVKLLSQAKDHGITPDYTSQLLATFEIETEDEGLVEPLSDRELEVLRLLGTDLSAPEIAAELVVSANTVRTHIKHIYSKLDTHSRYEAVQRAKELGLL